MIDWDKEFREAHLTSGPGSATLMIANFCPAGSVDRGGRNIYKDDKAAILKAAKKYGYSLLSEMTHAQFIKQKLLTNPAKGDMV